MQRGQLCCQPAELSAVRRSKRWRPEPSRKSRIDQVPAQFQSSFSRPTPWPTPHQYEYEWNASMWCPVTSILGNHRSSETLKNRRTQESNRCPSLPSETQSLKSSHKLNFEVSGVIRGILRNMTNDYAGVFLSIHTVISPWQGTHHSPLHLSQI